MPSASKDVDDYMGNYHGPGYSDNTAIGFLVEKGYTLTDKWEWKKTGIDHVDKMSHDEYMHMRYLIEEWDFGGLCA